MPDLQSFLPASVEIDGSLAFRQSLHFGGVLKNGSVTGGHFELGENATVDGDVTVQSASIRGAVKGDLHIAGRCHLGATARIVGAIAADSMQVDEGATLVGSVHIGPQRAASAR